MTRSRLLRLTALALWMFSLAVPGACGATKKISGNAPPASPASAPQLLGTAEGWTAYVYKEKTGQVCYLAAEPQKSEPANAKRKPLPTVMVTHRPEEKVANVVSFVEGYPLKPGSNVSLDIDGTNFELFTKNDTGWAKTSDLDKTIVEAMIKGNLAVAKGTPRKGTATTDTYSLAGFTQALAMIDKACGIKR